MPLLIPLAVSFASPDSNTALHIEHWAEDSITKRKNNNNNEMIRMGLMINNKAKSLNKLIPLLWRYTTKWERLSQRFFCDLQIFSI